jgi:endonuclease YncB( thermonuclease family)
LPREVKKENAIVAIEKKNQKYSAKKSAIHPKKLYVYKAKLDRVVDGDTIRVVLDLGFKIFHKEILRLRGIDAAEMKSDVGANSKKTLEKILKDVPFLIIKTTRVDIYGRYVADVFLAGEGDSDLQKVADSGVFLNQLLLDKGSAEIWKSV